MPNGKRVAVIGAGPAGLSCAHYLARLGYCVDVYDRADKAGGILSHAVPRFRLGDDVLDRELSEIDRPGITYLFGRALGADFFLSAMESEYDAVYLAAGLRVGRRLDVTGLSAGRAFDALQVLEGMRAGDQVRLGGRTVVIGGGSVASDVAISIKGAGAESVTVVCLEGPDEMPALAGEVADMLGRGVRIENGWGPVEVTSRSTLALRRCTRVFDESGGFAPLFDESQTMEVPFDQVVFAVGQELDPELAAHLGDAVGARGLVQVDAETLRVSGHANLYAGGDIVRGAGTVVQAVADGRRAAMSIDAATGAAHTADRSSS